MDKPDLTLQGRRVTGSQEDLEAGFSFGDFNAYADLGLYSEDSSCSSRVRFLQPVPSLPGLAEPVHGHLGSVTAGAKQAGCNSTVSLAKQQGIKPSSSNLSPTKHHAWRQMRTPLATGASGGQLLPSLPSSMHTTQSKGRHGKPLSETTAAAAAKRQGAHCQLATLLPAVHSTAHQAVLSPALQSRHAGRVEHSREPCRAQQSYSDSEHLTMIMVPDGIVTGFDAVQYFCSGAGKPGDLIYCNLCSASIHNSSSTGVSTTLAGSTRDPDDSALLQPHQKATAAVVTDSGFCGDGYSPYDLMAVPQRLADRRHHFVVSYHGVTQMTAGEPPDLIPHPEWLRQCELFAVLKGLSFFKQWRLRTAFSLWWYGSVRMRFRRRAEALEASLLTKDPAVQAAMQQAHWLCLHLSAAALPTGVQPKAAISTAGEAPALASAVMVPVLMPTTQTVASAASHPPGPCPCQMAAAVLAGSESGQGTQQASSSGSSGSQEAVWQKSSGSGQWRLVQQQSGTWKDAEQQQVKDAGAVLEPEKQTDSSAAVAAAVALSEQLASAAKGLLPDLQSRRSRNAASKQGTEGSIQHTGLADSGAAGVQKQMQAALAHSARLLHVLSGGLQPEALVTLADLAAWEAAARSDVTKTMAKLYARLQACIAGLQQHLAAELADQEQAAAAHVQEVYEAGRKPQLPWNVPTAFNPAQERQSVSMLLNRVAYCVNLLVTSHATQLAEAAMARLLSAVVLPLDAALAGKLCTQQQLGHLRNASSSTSPGWHGVRLRLHASLEGLEEDISCSKEPVLTDEHLWDVLFRLHPARDELVQYVSSLPSTIVALVASLDSLPIAWLKPTGSPCDHDSGGIGGGNSSSSNTRGACQRRPSYSRSRLPSGRARNVRLEIMWSSCRSLEIQAAVADIIDTQHAHTMSSPQLQPYISAPHMILFCRTFSAQAYLSSLPSARQLAADVNSLGTWLAQLSASSHHISVLGRGDSQGHDGGVKASPRAFNSCSMIDSSSSCGSNITHTRTSARGLLDIDVSTVRPVLLQTAKTTLGSLLAVLHPAFLQCCDSLRAQLDASIVTASERPDTLQPFVAWQAAMQSYSHARSTASRGQAAGLPTAATGGTIDSMLGRDRQDLLGQSATGMQAAARGSLFGMDALRSGPLLEAEALWMLLDVLRPGAGAGTAPDWLDSFHSSAAHGGGAAGRGSHINEAREAVLLAARQLGSGPAKAASSAMIGLQALMMSYKDAAKAAAAHTAVVARKLAPQMAELLAEDVQQLQDLAAELSSALAGPPATAAAAMQELTKAELQYHDLIQQHQGHLLAASCFPTSQLAQALEAYNGMAESLQKQLQVLAAFQAAQQAWDSQLELLHATRADSPNCKQQLLQLQTAGQGLLNAADSLEADCAFMQGSSGGSAASRGSGSGATSAGAASAVAAAPASQLTRAARLEVKAWQQRLPAAELLLHHSMQPRHVWMLLVLMALSEGGTLEAAQALLGQLGTKAGPSHGAATSSSCDRATPAGLPSPPQPLAEVQAALLSYGFMRQDGYEDVFLINSAVNAGGAEDAAGDSMCPHTTWATAGAAAAASSSIGALLVWVTRCPATASFLSRMQSCAVKEQQLAEQVQVIQDRLRSICVSVSSTRVAGVFLGDFAAVEQQLLDLQQQLEVVWQDRCHLGVLGTLEETQDMHQHMLVAMQACKSCQQQLLRLHNLTSHPALGCCLSAADKSARDAAIKPWASALLKLRCSTPASVAARELRATADSSVSSSSDTGAKGFAAAAPESTVYAVCGDDSRTSSCAAATAQEDGDNGDWRAGSAGAQHHPVLSCMAPLAAAALGSLALLHQVSSAVGPAILSELCQRWPRLRLVPGQALLRLLEELPAVFRSAWALQAQQQHMAQIQVSQQQLQTFLRLPAELFDVLFRGVNGLLLAPQILRQQVASHFDNSGSDSGQGYGSRVPGHAAPTAALFSGCLWEPLSAEEVSRGVGQLHVSALISAAGDGSASSGQLGVPVQGVVLQRLDLVGPDIATTSHHPEHSQQRHKLLRADVAGVAWTCDSCPATVLRQLHVAAMTALQRDVAAAIASANSIPVERWADAPCQVLLLADAVLWTRCATVALQQLETSNSYPRALRSLADAAVLRLETVSAALRGQRAGKFAGTDGSCTEKGSSWRGDAAAELDATLSRRQTEGEQRHGHDVQVLVNDTGRPPTSAQVEDDSAPVPGAAAAPAAPAGRPATPDTPALSPMQPDKPPAAAAAAAGTVRAPCSQGRLQRDTCSPPSISTAGSNPAQLSPRQVLGLQALAAAAACHRDVAFALIAAGAEATTSFVWGKQVRHYWQPETQELKVCFGPCQVPYSWQYSPAATASFRQTLSAQLLSNTALLTAAAALALSPVLGLDLTSLPVSQGHSNTCSGSLHSSTDGAAAISVIPLMTTTADALAVLFGVQAFHHTCTANTTAGSLRAWLQSLAAAAAAVAETGPSNTAAAGCTSLCSISGLHYLPPPVLSTLCQSLLQLKAVTVSTQNAGSSIQWPLCVLCEVPVQEALPAAVQGATTGQQEQHANVLGALQLSGRCIALQPPSACTVLELGLRQLGLTDVRQCSKVLAALMQQAAAAAAAAAGGHQQELYQSPQHQQQHVSQLPQGTHTGGTSAEAGSITSVGCMSSAAVLSSSICCVLRHLTGLQQAGCSFIQPGCSAWHALQPLVRDLLLPQVAAQQGQALELQRSLSAALQAAQQAGSISSLPPATKAGFAASRYPTAVPGSGSSGHTVWSDWSAEQVAAAAHALCLEWLEHTKQQQYAGVSSHSGGGSSSSLGFRTLGHISKVLMLQGGFRQPLCLVADAAAQAAAALHRGLQLHAACVHVGPPGVGKTLAWQLLRAVYRRHQHQQQQQQQQAGSEGSCLQDELVFVHCYPSVLLEAAQHVQAASQAAALGVSDEAPLQELISSWYAAAVAQQHQAAQQAQQQPQALNHQQLLQQPRVVLVLDTTELAGPLQHYLLQQLDRQASTAAALTAFQPHSGWAGLPGCVGCIVETSSIAATSPALLQQLPLVAVTSRLLDSKQQLLADMLAAFRPLQVAVGCGGCRVDNTPTGDTASPLHAVITSGERSFRAGSSNNGCSGSGSHTCALPKVAASSPSSQTAPAAAAGALAAASAMPGVQLSVSADAIHSLAALLAELVAAGLTALAVPGQHNTRTAAAPSTATLTHSAGQAAAAAELLTEERELCRGIISIAAAMWGRGTLNSSALLAASCSHSSSGSSVSSTGGTESAHNATSAGRGAVGAAASIAEQFAARLLLYAASWVLCGQCPQPQRQLPVLQTALLAVLSGAGYAWAAPPAGLGLLGARPSLSTGQWVSWLTDLQSIQRRQEGHAAAPASSGSCSKSSGMQAAPQLSYHACAVCSVGGDMRAGNAAGASPMPGFDLQYDNSSASCPSDAVFLHSARTCALQCFMYWVLAAGLSPAVVAPHGCGVRGAVQHLLAHTWSVSALGATSPAAAAAATGGQFDGHQGWSSQGVCSGSGLPCMAGSGAASDSDCLIVPLAPSLTAQQAAAVLKACGCYKLLPPGSFAQQKKQDSQSRAADNHGYERHLQDSCGQRVVLCIADAALAGPAQLPGTSPGTHGAWLRQLLDASQPLLPTAGAAAAGTGHSSTCRWLQLPQLQVVCISAAAGSLQGEAHAIQRKPVGQVARHMLYFNAECLGALSNSNSTTTSTSEHSAAAGSCADGAFATDASSAVGTGCTVHDCYQQSVTLRQPMQYCLASNNPLVDPASVMSVLLDRWGPLFPFVPHVPRLLQLAAVRSIWVGLTAALAGLQAQGLLPAGCCFDLRHYQPTLIRLVTLCQAVSELSGAAAARQQQAELAGIHAQGVGSPQAAGWQTVPQTPCSPGMLATPGSCRTPHWLNVRKMPLKALCMMVLEVLSRAVADRAASAEQQQALQRLVLLLVVQHLAVLGQPTAAGPITAAQHSLQPAQDASTAATSSSSTPRSPELLQTLAELVGTQDSCGVGNSSSCNRCSKSSLAQFWQTLQQLPEAQLSDSLRQECLPAMLSGRLVGQMMAMAAWGRDPIHNDQPLHVEVAQQELKELLSQQLMLRQQQNAQDGDAAAGAAATQLPSGCGDGGSSSSSSSRRDRSSVEAAAFAAADRLLPCSVWVAAVHKLMWHIEAASMRSGNLEADELITSPMMSAVCSVSVLSGPSVSALTAAAVTAAAATGCVVTKKTLPELQAGEQQLLMLLHGLSAAAMQSAGPASAPVGKSLWSQRTKGSAEACVEGPSDTAVTLQMQQRQLAVELPPVVLVLDLTDAAAGQLHSPEASSVLQRWCSQLPWVAVSNSTHPVLSGTDDRGQWLVHLILLCLPSQQQLLQGFLGTHCYQLAVPGQLSKEQLQEDCRVQLLADFSSALSGHVQAACCAAEQQHQRHDSKQQQLPAAEDEAAGEQQQQQAVAAAALPAARHLADRLAAALAEVHRSAVEAYQAHFTRRASAATCTPTPDAAQTVGRSHTAPNPSNSNSSSSMGRCSGSACAYDMACAAAPMTKPFDALRVLQRLLPACTLPLDTRRAALRAGLAGASRYLKLLAPAAAAATYSDSEQHRVQQVTSLPRAAAVVSGVGLTEAQAAAMQAVTSSSKEGRAGAVAGAVGSAMEAGLLVAALREGLERLAVRWADELQQVDRELSQLLPTAMLAALELTYLGPLPAALQQQLSSRWAVLLTQAASLGRMPAPAATPAPPAAAGVDAGGSSTGPAVAAAAAANVPWTGTRHTGASGDDSISRSSSSSALPRLMVRHQAIPASVVMAAVQLPQPADSLSQQLQAAAAALSVACQPLFVMDPWSLLPSLLGLSPGEATAAAELSVREVCSAAASTEWLLLTPCSEEGFCLSSTASGSEGSNQGLRDWNGSSQLQPVPVAEAAAAAFAAGRSVCLQLHSISHQQQLVEEVVAAWYNCQGMVGPSSSSSMVARSTVASRGGQAAQAPKLLVHSSSPCVQVPPRIAGLMTVMSIGGPCCSLQPEPGAMGMQTTEEDTHQGASSRPPATAATAAAAGPCCQEQQTLQAESRPQQQQQHQPLPPPCREALTQQVQRLVLPLADEGRWLAVIAGQQEAQEACELLDQTEAMVLQHLSQEPPSPSLRPILLRSLDREVQQLQQQQAEAECAAGVAAEGLQALTAHCQPLVDSLARVLGTACTSDAAAAAAAAAGAAYGPAQQQDQQCVQQRSVQGVLQPQQLQQLAMALPARALEAVLRRVVQEVVQDCTEDATEVLAAPAKVAAAAADHAVPYRMRAIYPAETVDAATMELLQALQLLLPGAAACSQQGKLNRPDGLRLLQTLCAVPADVPVAVFAPTATAALAAILEAAAAAEVPADGIRICHASAYKHQPPLIPMRKEQNASCRPTTSPQQFSHPTGLPTPSHGSNSTICWHVVLVDADDAVHAASLEVQQWQLQHRQQQRQRAPQLGCGPVRLWLAVSSSGAPAAASLLSGHCLMYPVAQGHLDCPGLGLQQLLHRDQLGIRHQEAVQDTHGGVRGSGHQGWAGLAGCTLDMLLQAQGAELLQQQDQHQHMLQSARHQQQEQQQERKASSTAQAGGLQQLWLSHSSRADGGNRQYASSPSNVDDDGGMLSVLQPLMVAVAAAAASCASGGSSHATGRTRTGYLSDLFSMQDLLHAKLLLQRIAANALDVAGAAESVVGTDHVSPPPAAAAGTAHSRAHAGPLVLSTSTVHKALRHQTRLRLDLPQLQELLLWSVLGPACTNEQQLAAARRGLEAALSAAALGVREQQEVFAGVQVLGGSIADAFEGVADSKHSSTCVGDEQSCSAGVDHRGHVASDLSSGVVSRVGSSSHESGDSDTGVLLPLGLCLGLQDLFALLQRRLC